MQWYFLTAHGEMSMAKTQVMKQHSWAANLPGRYKILIVICPLLALVLLASLGTFSALRLQQQTSRWVQHTYQVLLTIDQARQGYQTSVISVRGYVLSPDAAGLTTFESESHAPKDRSGRIRLHSVGHLHL